MIRLLTEAPGQYNLPKLVAEVKAAFPSCLGVNEVAADRRYIAAYFEVDAPEQAALAATVGAHDPTPEPAPPSLEQRLADVEEALALLHLEVSKVAPAGDT